MFWKDSKQAKKFFGVMHFKFLVSLLFLIGLYFSLKNLDVFLEHDFISCNPCIILPTLWLLNLSYVDISD